MRRRHRVAWLASFLLLAAHSRTETFLPTAILAEDEVPVVATESAPSVERAPSVDWLPNVVACPVDSEPVDELSCWSGGATTMPHVFCEESSAANMPTKLDKFPLGARWGNGFELYTENEEFTLQIHNLTQFDYRDYSEGFGPLDPQDTFVFPRQWLIMNGKITQPVDYFFAFAFAFNSVNLLDGFINWHILGDKIQLRAGRYKTPFTYEFYALPIDGLVNPERSLFFNNFGLNRDLGVMLWGTVLGDRMDYAAGIYNGTRNGFVDDNNDNKDFAGYVNFKPFVQEEGTLLQHLNFGVSTDIGDQDDLIAAPRTFRTLVPIIGVDTVGVAFLNLAEDVRNLGPRRFWSPHCAWYHGGLSLIGEWQAGWEGLARRGSDDRSKITVDSFYVQAGYFVTGEQVTGRGLVQPLRPFDIRRGRRGPGAWEPFFRYNYLNIDPIILSFSDGRPWTNNVQTWSFGANWYWNPHLKFAFEWGRALFGEEVFVNANETTKAVDTVLLRTQISF